MKSRSMLFAMVVAAALVAVAVVVPETYATVASIPQLLDPMSFDLGGGTLLMAQTAVLRVKTLSDERVALHRKVAENMRAMEAEGVTTARKTELLDENDRIFVDIDAKEREIKQIERTANLESELSGERTRHPDLSNDPKERAEQAKLAMEAYVRFGYAQLSEEARQIIIPGRAAQAFLAEQMKHLRAYVKEGRDLSTGSSGAVLPNTYWSEIEKNMLAFGGMLGVVRPINTQDGNPFILPTLDDTGNEADLVSEAATTSTSVDPTMSSLTLNAYTYRTFMKVSREMLQDASFNINEWVFGEDGFGMRLARKLNRHFTMGTGASQPNGVITATSSGHTMASGNSVAYDDFVDLEHSVDPSYRPNARWMFHDSVLKASKKIKDSQNNPIWMPGLAGRAPDTILNYPYAINQHMAPLDSGGDKVMAFGNFRKYIQRNVVGGGFPVLMRLDERFADAGQVGFFLFSRHDGDLLDAGTDPIKHAVTPSP